jgi:hypothetical protein
LVKCTQKREREGRTVRKKLRLQAEAAVVAQPHRLHPQLPTASTLARRHEHLASRAKEQRVQTLQHTHAVAMAMMMMTTRTKKVMRMQRLSHHVARHHSTLLRSSDNGSRMSARHG